MEIPTMRDKITLRAFAISKAMELSLPFGTNLDDVLKNSKVIEKYIIGDANLPEMAEDFSMQALKLFGSLNNNVEKQIKIERINSFNADCCQTYKENEYNLWVARNADGVLSIHRECPYDVNGIFESSPGTPKIYVTESINELWNFFDDRFFSEVTYENSPQRIRFTFEKESNPDNS